MFKRNQISSKDFAPMDIYNLTRFGSRVPGGATFLFGNNSESFRSTSIFFTDPHSTRRELSFRAMYELCMLRSDNEYRFLDLT